MNNKRSKQKERRCGVAAVELAVCLPPLILLVFASIEGCSMIFVTQSLSAAAYEGIRVAIKDDGNTADAQAVCEQVLSDRGVNGARIRFNPSNVESAARGELVRLVITAPCDSNSLMPSWFFGGRRLESRVFMAKE